MIQKIFDVFREVLVGSYLGIFIVAGLGLLVLVLLLRSVRRKK